MLKIDDVPIGGGFLPEVQLPMIYGVYEPEGFRDDASRATIGDQS